MAELSEYINLCNLIMQLFQEATKECGLFANVSEKFTELPPVQCAFEIKFNSNDNKRIKYFFNDNVNWIVFTINFEYGDKLCDWCCEKLKQQFKNQNIIIEKCINSIDVYSEEDKKYGQTIYREFLEQLKQDKSKETQTIIKNKMKAIIINNYEKYLKDVHKSLSELINKNFTSSKQYDQN